MVQDSIFKQIASHVHELWRKEDRAHDAFAKVSAEALGRAELTARIAPLELLHWAETSPQLPAQLAGENDYGDPAITLYRDDQIRIEALFWANNANGIHQHKTPGAFCAITGGRIHNQYDFLNPAEVSPGMIVGTLARRSTEVIRPGTIRPITPGASFIHDQWFLGLQSLSISVRLLDNAATALPLIYFPPHLAWSNSVEGGKPTIQKRLAGLRMARNYGQDAYVKIVEGMIASQSPSLAVAALIEAHPSCSEEQFARLFGLTCQHHQSLAPYLETVFRAAARREFLESFLKTCREGELRFFLGLVWSEVGRNEFHDLLAAEHPGSDPVKLAATWCDAEDEAQRRAVLPAFLAA